MRRDFPVLPALHLWHAENNRKQLDENDVLLQACLAKRQVETLRGMRQLEDGE